VEIEERERSNRKEADVRRWAHDTLSSIGDGVVCTDIDGTVIFINTVAEELTGWRATEALGRPMRDVFNIINETSRAPAVNPIGRVLSEGVVLGLANHTVLIGQSGREVPIDDSGAPIRNAQREIVGAVLVFRDISDRKLAEELLQRTVARLTRSNEDLTAFAHALSHDLQEPVRAIGTISELLVQQHGAQLDDKAREHLHFIIGAAARLTQMIRSLLAYARMVNAQEGTMSPVRLADAVNWAEANLHQLVNVHGVRIECTDLPTVVGNEVQLVQIFQNLIENAIKYRSTEAPILHISATEHDNDWEIILRDNGLGIDPCYHQEIFRLFKRAHTIGDGSGIGLAVCKRIVERHGGTIWVNSTPGDGSTFHFTLSKDPQLAV
jgi:PAS domain S-box-containing protein